MIIRSVLLVFMMLASLFCSGCVSSRATTTLKARPSATCSVGEGKFRIAVYEFSDLNQAGSVAKVSEQPVWLNQIAVELYPGIFSDDKSAWPISVSAACLKKRDYNYAVCSLLTLYIVPFPVQDTLQYRVGVDISSILPSSNSVSFAVEEAMWMAWPPLGLIPVSGPSDARGTSLYSSAIVKLEFESIVEATVMQLTQLDASQISKLTNQTWLAKVAIEDKNESVRKAATRKITDQTCLAEVVFNSAEYDIRATAARKINDQAVLSKLAISDYDLNIRAYAAGRITDQRLISQLGEDRDPIIRMTAVEKMEDQALLLRISVNDSEANVRQLAKNRLAKLKRDSP